MLTTEGLNKKSCLSSAVNFLALKDMRKDESCRVQEEIKSGRGGRQVQISFPDDVLQSGRLQKMLETKVISLQTQRILN